MAISYVGNISASSNGTTQLTVSNLIPGLASGDFTIVALGFEGVAAGSGPWVDGTFVPSDHSIVSNTTGWLRLLYQAPSATGVGLEVWAAIHGSGRTLEKFNLISSLAVVAAVAAYRGQAHSDVPPPTASPVRVTATAQWTGDNPAAPSLSALAGELVVAVTALQVNTPGYTAPAGYTQRIDVARAGAHGNAEVAIADKVATTAGATGTIPFGATTTGSPKGATATIAVQPSTAGIATVGPAISFSYPVS
jgi:hypothetical protein